jgi:glycosyltransferase involved in cell wall biosynthesis
LKEALLAGLPVIALQDAATSEWVQDAALYFDAGDDETLAAHLMQVYKDEALQGSLSAKAKATAVKYSWAESARRVGEVLAHSVK